MYASCLLYSSRCSPPRECLDGHGRVGGGGGGGVGGAPAFGRWRDVCGINLAGALEGGRDRDAKRRENRRISSGRSGRGCLRRRHTRRPARHLSAEYGQKKEGGLSETGYVRGVSALGVDGGKKSDNDIFFQPDAQDGRTAGRWPRRRRRRRCLARHTHTQENRVRARASRAFREMRSVQFVLFLAGWRDLSQLHPFSDEVFPPRLHRWRRQSRRRHA